MERHSISGLNMELPWCNLFLNSVPFTKRTNPRTTTANLPHCAVAEYPTSSLFRPPLYCGSQETEWSLIKFEIYFFVGGVGQTALEVERVEGLDGHCHHGAGLPLGPNVETRNGYSVS